MLKKYYSVFGPALRVLDAVILVVCWIAAYYLRKNYPLGIMTNALPPFDQYWAYSIVIVLLWGTVFSLLNLYSSHRISRRTAEAYKVLRAHGLALLVFISLTYLITAYKLSRGVFVYFGVLSSIMLVAARVNLRNFVRHMRAKGYNLQRVLVVGTGPVAVQAVRRLTRHPELGLRIVGFVAARACAAQDTHPNPASGAVDGLPILGSIRETADLVHRHDADKLVIALSRAEAGQMEAVLESLKDDIVDVILIPDIYDYVALGYQLEDFDGLPLVSLNETPIMGFNFLLKRMFDVLIASVALILLSPIMLILAALVRLTTRGPIFYGQERMSLNGKPFRMLKFRSMGVDQKGDVGLLTKKDDPRVTAVGRLMRGTSLDELPQFFNVLAGDMSIVGPRPERTWVVEEVRTKIPRYMLKHKVKAGITGWAQVNGWRGDTSLEKRIEYDLFYIKNWSIMFDLKILFLTVFRINRNAY
ncbi:MAG: undecaprenyl-phosphate glucose phosphotransferase [Deltaproteobacteria bacterium]|nr:undecaprenyl-phosphate glucose phosphotransferase [Deltaproteobacteria bacterium]